MSGHVAKPCEGPLAGLRVLDLTSVLMGPYCTQILADMGAEVIKLESPEGDVIRDAGPMKHRKLGATFCNLNRGKKSIVVNLREAEGREICLQLASRCDVFIHSIRPQALKKLKLEYTDVLEINPSIVFANLYGFGRAGRYAGRAAYDDTIQAISGLAMLVAERQGEPQYVPSVIADKVSGLTAAYAVLAALFHREKTGQGQEVDVPMFETIVSFNLIEHLTGALFDPPLGRPIYRRLMSANRKPYKTADGYLSVLIYTDGQWQRFATLSGVEHLLSDKRFSTVLARQTNIDAFYEIISGLIRNRPTSQWQEVLEAAQIPHEVLKTLDDLFEDPHLMDVSFFRDVEDPLSGRLTMPDFPVRFSRTPAGFSQGGPSLGRDTALVLRELGYTPDEIEAFAAKNIVNLNRVEPTESMIHARSSSV